MTNVTQFMITTLGNLHVGSGEQNFGVVDNLVQKDPITDVPMINSSSLKGAIKDHFVSVLNYDIETLRSKTLFGNADNAGEVKFLQAELLALPVRSNKQLYFLATTPQILKDYLLSYKTMTKKYIDLEIPKIDKNTIVISTDDTDCFVEDYEVSSNDNEKLKSISKKLFDAHPLALISDDVFKLLSLPIITRNKIAKTEDDDNNLFYEEVIPRRTIFYTYIITPDENDIIDDKVERVFKTFIEDMKKENIQIGANASIGYGLCEFKESENE